MAFYIPTNGWIYAIAKYPRHIMSWTLLCVPQTPCMEPELGMLVVAGGGPPRAPLPSTHSSEISNQHNSFAPADTADPA